MKIFNKLKNLIRKILPPFLISWYHFLLALLAAIIYCFPSYQKKLKVIGITGTNGKSTVVKMASKILEEAGFSVAYSSSIKFKIGKKETENVLRMTMPGRFKMQRFLRQALNNNCQYAVLEVTSEGIKQHRHRFIDFDVVLFTNLTPEHIEAHGSFEKYREAKGKLFKTTGNIHILNLDDKNIEYFLKFPAEKKYGYTINSELKIKDEKIKVVKAKNCLILDKGIKFSVNNSEINLRLLGNFNIYNALASICVGLSQGIDLRTCKSALEKIEGIPGRMEIVISKPFKVLVDYAFTPDALEKVYQTIKNNFGSQKMICVLGAAGGGRDKWKRPVLGKIAAKYCDNIIITNEDPYNEDPMEIINQVAEGAGLKAKKILDRRKAIRQSLKEAKKGDIVVITGKGSEPCICIAGGKKIPWDDRKVAREEFKRLKRS
ncbi:MAG: UDP-N-acetylmuramoyl-L-alanyl-D-glutamate--2,6-diaminopimelate ligase [Candidatus Nealsonbacteria bacterium]|nr:MAG: UDP-N-acetylmuramoyl-L-alanyl-D-glutamate--2,6-diaminopimelate ligase [Candidatus Nealsonbacteria bacterium]